MAQADGAGIAIRRLRADDAEIWRDLRIECLTRHPAAFGASAEAEGARSLDLWRAGLERDCVLARSTVRLSRARPPIGARPARSMRMSRISGPSMSGPRIAGGALRGG